MLVVRESRDPIADLERQEVIRSLSDEWDWLWSSACYTKGGRINLEATSRLLGLSRADLLLVLSAFREDAERAGAT